MTREHEKALAKECKKKLKAKLATGKKPIPTCKKCGKKHWPFQKCEEQKKPVITTIAQTGEKKKEGLSRNELMMFAKARGVKNYRVLNKAELDKVVSPDTTQETIDRVVKAAVDRWKSGWGNKGGRTSKTIVKGV